MYRLILAVHDAYMAAQRTVKPRFKALRRTFIRQWRKKRGLSLEVVADRIGITHASLSRIERGLQPYSQPILEALAVEFQTDPASLLMRDPGREEGIWSIWDQAKEGERRMIEEVARTIVKTGT